MKKVYIMTREKEVELHPNDLTRIVIVCPNCEAEQIMDLASDIQGAKLENTEKHVSCGICNKQYEITIIHALRSLREFLSNMKSPDAKVFFRLWIKENQK